MVRNGFGCGEVKFARTFLDWRYVRSFSALSEESSSTKHKLDELKRCAIGVGKSDRGEAGKKVGEEDIPLGFSVHFVFRESNIFDIL